MLIYVDIDETICTSPEDRNYENAVPLKERIIKINKLYDQGNTIVYWTARGTGSGIDWGEVTEKQFEEWGVKYHELHFGKPVYDLFIDDKNINSDIYFGSFNLKEEIATHEFVVYDPDSGKIKDRIVAHCKATDHLPDTHQTEIVVLKHVDGILNNNLYYPKGTTICMADSYVDSNVDLNLKIKEGAEEEFEFFMKNGYHKSGSGAS